MFSCKSCQLARTDRPPLTTGSRIVKTNVTGAAVSSALQRTMPAAAPAGAKQNTNASNVGIKCAESTESPHHNYYYYRPLDVWAKATEGRVSSKLARSDDNYILPGSVPV